MGDPADPNFVKQVEQELKLAIEEKEKEIRHFFSNAPKWKKEQEQLERDYGLMIKRQREDLKQKLAHLNATRDLNDSAKEKLIDKILLPRLHHHNIDDLFRQIED